MRAWSVTQALPRVPANSCPEAPSTRVRVAWVKGRLSALAVPRRALVPGMAMPAAFDNE